MKKLYRDKDNAIIGGVCSGLGEYFDTDPSLIRILWLLIFLFAGVGFWLYIISWILLPSKPICE